MDIEKLIERLKHNYHGYSTVENNPEETFHDMVECLTALSTLQAENEKLRAENIRWGQVASEQGKQLDKLRAALDELEQVKHQLDSYRAYYDDMASKPNCNTCADKDCKYRPIPGDTVRANCPLWRGPEEEG